MTRQLTEEEFKATFADKMRDVTKTAEPVVDIWTYVEELTSDNTVGPEIYEDGRVSSVYRNDKDTFEHVLLPTDNENVFTVIVVDLINKNIFGHHRLDLNKKYGLT